MKPLRRIASELLGFDRREKRSSYILIVMLVILVTFRFAFMRPSVVSYDARVGAGELQADITPDDTELTEGNTACFRFDPNTATIAELERLGMTERQAKTLINYRNAGAHFRTAGDLLKVYGIDSSLFARLSPWIDIKPVKQSYRQGGETSKGTDLHSADNQAIAMVTAPVIIDLNSCSAPDLEKLPGIGSVLSARIIRYRDLLGGFRDTRQLAEVYGLDSVTVDRVTEFVTVSSDGIRRIMIDTCSFAEMARHPYIGSEAARAIMKFRSLMGCDFIPDDLVDQHVITRSKLDLMKPYVVTLSEVRSDSINYFH